MGNTQSNDNKDSGKNKDMVNLPAVMCMGLFGTSSEPKIDGEDDFENPKPVDKSKESSGAAQEFKVEKRLPARVVRSNTLDYTPTKSISPPTFSTPDQSLRKIPLVATTNVSKKVEIREPERIVRQSSEQKIAERKEATPPLTRSPSKSIVKVASISSSKTTVPVVPVIRLEESEHSFLREFKLMMVEGFRVRKHGKKGRPHLRTIRLSNDASQLFWGSKKMKAFSNEDDFVNVADIVEIKKGAFGEGKLNEIQTSRAFSIITDMRRLNFETNDTETCDLISDGFNLLVKEAKFRSEAK